MACCSENPPPASTMKADEPLVPARRAPRQPALPKRLTQQRFVAPIGNASQALSFGIGSSDFFN